MKKRLLIIRNPDSPLLGYLDLSRKNQEIFLTQNAVFSEKLREGDVKLLADDARAAKIDVPGKLADYETMLDAVFTADLVICI